jgi:hypothetical protein
MVERLNLDDGGTVILRTFTLGELHSRLDLAPTLNHLALALDLGLDLDLRRDLGLDLRLGLDSGAWSQYHNG